MSSSGPESPSLGGPRRQGPVGRPGRGGGARVGPDLAQRLQRKVDEEQAAGRLPSLVAGLARDGALVWWGAQGTGGLGRRRPTVATQYRIGSITKTFVAVMVMRLRDEGAVDLNDRIGQHLPPLGQLPVTVGQLLSHTSGLRAETPGPWWERTPGTSFAEVVAAAGRPSDLLWRPGRRFHYSNPGFAILGELVARVRSAPLADVLKDELWGPLAMGRTTWRPVEPHARGLAVHPHADAVLEEPEHDAMAMAPAGQLWSTIADLATWSEVLLGHRPEVLAPATAAEMTEPIGLLDAPGQPWVMGYGLGLQLWNQAGRHRFGHTGGMPGHWAMLLIDEDSKDVAVGLANSTYSGFRPAFFDDLLNTLGAEQPRPRPAFTAVTGGNDAAAVGLVGTWYWGPVPYRMDLRPDGRLELRSAPEGRRDCTFEPAGDGTYTGRHGYFDGERLRPCRRPDGAVSHLDIASFVFTRSPYDPAVPVPGGVDDKGWQAG